MDQQQPTTVQQASNPFAIVSLVLGICAVLSGLFFVGALLGLTAIILGIISLKKGTGKGLAIAGIITGSLGIVVSLLAVLLVFLAVPSMQRSQRDVVRKNDIGLIVTEIEEYKTNNQGELPNPEMVAESLKTRSLDIVTSGDPTTETALYKVGVDCRGDADASAYAVRTLLESGDQYCQDM